MMRRTLLPIVLSGIVLTGCKPEPAAEKETQTDQTVRQELTQLDLDGNFLLFMDTSGLKKSIDQFIDTVADMAKTEVPAAQVDGIVNLVKKGIDESGLLSIDTCAMSTKPLENGLTRSISVFDYGKEDADTLLWRVLLSEPKLLKGVQYAPADTVFLADTTTGLSEIWNIFNEVTSDYLPPEAQTELKEQIAMLEMMVGTEFDELFGSLENEILFSLQLSETEKCVIPVDGTTLTIPEPSVIIGLQTKNPMLSSLILEKLKQAEAPLTEVEVDGFTLHTIYLPMPLPLSFAPTLVQTDDYLLIGTNPETIAKALESYRNKNGLIADARYKKLLADAPEKVSAVSYLSPRLGKAYSDVVSQIIEESTKEEMASLLKTYFENTVEVQFGKYVLKTSTGIYAKTYSSNTLNPGEVIASAGAGCVGMMAAIAIPSFQKARSNAIERSCESNRRLIQATKQQWAIDNGEMGNAQPTAADLDEYIRGGFDALQCPAGGTIEINPLDEEPSCSIHGSLDY
ncbi:MAG: DUF3352 domain-containing protein [Pontiellaceae bacterium]|nr:DUF3352 domain-containing protein [Pontiellaceae bacterium]